MTHDPFIPFDYIANQRKAYGLIFGHHFLGPIDSNSSNSMSLKAIDRVGRKPPIQASLSWRVIDEQPRYRLTMNEELVGERLAIDDVLGILKYGYAYSDPRQFV